MSISVMLQQLASGICGDFCCDTVVFPATGTSDLFWQNVEESGDAGDCICIYFHYAWNTFNASADGGIFWTLFYFWHPYFHGL